MCAFLIVLTTAIETTRNISPKLMWKPLAQVEISFEHSRTCLFTEQLRKFLKWNAELGFGGQHRVDLEQVSAGE